MRQRTVELERQPSRNEPLRSEEDATVSPVPLLARPFLRDSLLATLLTATSLVGVIVHLHVDLPEGGEEATIRVLDGLGIVLILLQTVPLAWRRQMPLFVLAVTTFALFSYAVNGYFTSFAALGFLVALYTAAAYRERRVSIPAGIAAGLMVLLILYVQREPIEPDAVLAECLHVAGGGCLGGRR